MCGRYVVTSAEDERELAAIIAIAKAKARGGAGFEAGEIFPTMRAPVVAASRGVWTAGPERVDAGIMTWGYRIPGKSSPLINARAETLTKKASFAVDFSSRRCAVVASGFYEWSAGTDAPAQKTKYLVTPERGGMFFMAGIWRRDSEGVLRFVIITTGANDTMQPLHHRMPVLLGRSELEGYINDRKTAEALIRCVPERVGYRPAV